VNATPVFCDIIGIEEPNIDPVKVEKLITVKTKAVIVMHYGGFACRMNDILAICKKHKLKLIEDSCHGPLSDYEGKKLGTIGDIGCFSFFSNKNISTGEGGMLITNNEESFKKVQLLRSHGMTSLSYERSKGHSTGYDVMELGYNYRMDDIRASIGIEQLKKLENDITRRIGLRAYYLDRLRRIEGITIPFEFQFSFSSNYIFPIVLQNSNARLRGEVRAELAERGIQTSIHYPPVHKFRIYNQKDYDLPLTEYYADNEITLPMYADLSVEEIDYIVESLENVLEKLKLSKPALI
jgi:dTDP-4-amino-4,6-dideoxygalactose transaminase